MPRLTEKYRPATLDEIVGQPKAITAIRRVIERPGFDGGAFWIVGPSGAGKTSLARIIAKTFADGLGIDELDGQACTVDEVRRIDTTGIAPTASVIARRASDRADEVVPSLDREDALANGPDVARAAGLFKVPRVKR